MMERGLILKGLAGIGLALVLGGWIFRGSLPSPETVPDFLMEAPVQQNLPRGTSDFSVEAGGMVYAIHPLYTYEIQGMVVSESEADSFFNIYHSKWKDSINVKDLCIIWGQNIRSGVFEKMNFRNGSFHCYCDFKSGTGPGDWGRFRPDQLSNNHVLPSTPEIRNAILGTRRGDLVRFSGFLAEYSHSGGSFRRGTSTRRDDTGDGACETIYVTEYKVVQAANRAWHFGYGLGWLMLGGAFVGMAGGFFLDTRREAREMERLRAEDTSPRY